MNGRLAEVDDPPVSDDQTPERPSQGLPVDRAVILIGLFVLVTALLVGGLHPTSSTSSTSSTTTTSSSSTTSPAGSATSTSPPTTKTAPPTKSTTATTTITKVSKAPVLVANASGTSGVAATVTNELQVAGWNVQAPINATAKVPSSNVYYVAGQKAAATGVATTLHLAANTVLPYTTAAPVSTIGTAEILVVVGPDLVSGVSSTTTTPGT